MRFQMPVKRTYKQFFETLGCATVTPCWQPYIVRTKPNPKILKTVPEPLKKQQSEFTNFIVLFFRK